MNKEERKQEFDKFTIKINDENGIAISKNEVDIASPGLYINGNKIENGHDLLTQCEKLNRALLDIKEYIEEYKFAYTNPLNQNVYNVVKCQEFLDIVNKALGDDKK